MRRSNARIAAYKRKYEEISEITGIPQDTRRMAVTRTTQKVLTGNASNGIMRLANDDQLLIKRYVVREDLEGVKKLQERIKTNLGISKVDFTELKNADVTSEFVDYIEKLQIKHGQRFNSIIAQRPFNGAHDLTWVTPSRELVINPEYFNSKEAMKDILEELLKNKILPKDCKTIEYIATHEYAHLVTMDEINNPKSIVRTLFRRMEIKDFISQNAMIDPYEFAADYLSYKKKNKISQKLKEFFDWEDL